MTHGVVAPGTVNRRALVALLAADAVSICGTTMTLLAVPWFVLISTGSPARTGLVAGVEIAGVALSSVLAAPLLDRLGRRRCSVVSDVIAAVAVAAIPLAAATVGLPFWALLSLAAVVGLVRAPGQTARSAMMPTLITLAGTSPERGASAYDGVNRGARMAGAPLAGVLIAALGAANLLYLDAVSFLLSAALVRLFVPLIADESGGRPPGYVEMLRVGFGYLRRDRLIAAMVIMVFFTNLLDVAAFAVLMPVYANDVLHSSVALGLFGAAFGIGALAGTMIYGTIGARLPRWFTYTATFLIVGAPRYVLMAMEPPLAVLLAALALAGLAAGAINPILSVVEYERIPDRLRPMVFGAITGGVMAGAPLGALLAGFGVEVFGLTATLLGTGALYLLATLCPAIFPVWREMDAPNRSTPPAPDRVEACPQR